MGLLLILLPSLVWAQSFACPHQVAPPIESHLAAPHQVATCGGVDLVNWSSDSRFVGIWYYEEAAGGGTTLALDSSPATNPLRGLTAVNGNCQEGLQSWDVDNSFSDILVCDVADGCTVADFDFTSGDFTVGGWIYTTEEPGAGPFGASDKITFTSMSFYSTGAGWLMGVYRDTVNSVNEFSFIVANPANSPGMAVGSAATFALNTWKHHTARYTDSSNLMEQFIDGVLDVNTASSDSPTAGSNFRYGIQSASRASKGQHDEGWAFRGGMIAVDVCRIVVCGLRGQLCKCDPGDVTSYVSRPRHVSSGGPINCTMPACNKAGPT